MSKEWHWLVGLQIPLSCILRNQRSAKLIAISNKEIRFTTGNTAGLKIQRIQEGGITNSSGSPELLSI